MLSIKEWVARLNILNPKKVKIISSHLDTVDLEIDGKIYFNVIPKRPFPLTKPEFIIFYTTDNHEIGILKDYRKLDKESREKLEKVLNLIYFMPKIKRVISIKFSGGKYKWIVETDKGIIEFETWSSCIRLLNNGKVIVKDISGNVYCIDNLFLLDSKSISLISAFI